MMRRIKVVTLSIAVTMLGCTLSAYGQTPGVLQPTDGAGSGSHLTQKQIADLESYVESQFRQYRIPGGAVALVDQGNVAFEKGMGVLDIKTNKPATPSTMYAVGSLVKPMTSAAILQLRDKGELDLQESVQTYLPWFRMADSESSSQITVYQLLTHTSGIPQDADGQVFRDLKPTDTSIEAGVRALKNVQLDAKPGTHFEYSNMNYAVLGMIIEKVSGQPYDQYMKSNLFTALGMGKTSFEPNPNDPFVASKYLLESGEPLKVPQLDKRYEFVDPAGSRLVSSVGELSRFVEAELGDGLTTITSNSLIQESSAHGVKLPKGVGGDTYALGWVESHVHNSLCVWHVGLTPGSYAMVVMIPSKHVGAIVLAGGSGIPANFCVGGVSSILSQN